MDINAVCESYDQAEALSGVRGIGLLFDPETSMPYVFRNEDALLCEHYLSKPYVLARNIDELGFLRDKGYKGRIYADHTLYTFNRQSRKMLKDLGVLYDTAPLELTFRELKERGMSDSELMVYGRVPMMISAGCVYKNSNNDKCYKIKKDGESRHIIRLTDRMDTDFPVLCDCRHCYNVIFNSVPLSLHGEWDRVTELAPASLRLYFTTESGEEARSIAEFFSHLSGNGDPCPGDMVRPYKEFTRGHFIKGVE